MTRVILHCDMNNFFASVECKLNPSLKEKCIAVCGSKEQRRGIVLAKNEKAKKYGVITGEAIWQAQKKCPELVVVSPHYEYYSYYSNLAKQIYCRYTDLVEPFGIDECWLDVTGSIKLFGRGREIANKIRRDIRDELGLTVSVGVSFNKVFAKLGSDLKKPDATTVITPNNYKNMLYALPASDLIGVGKSAFDNLKRIGIETIGELAMAPCDMLKNRLGKQGETIWKYANGLDNSPVTSIDYMSPIKSIGHGTTTPCDLQTNVQVRKLIMHLSLSVSHKLRIHNLVACGIQISIRDSALVTREFQCTLSHQTANATDIANEGYSLFLSKYDWHSSIHSLTVRVINLLPSTSAFQLDMCHDNNYYIKKETIDKTVDTLHDRFGENTLVPLILLDYENQRMYNV